MSAPFRHQLSRRKEEQWKVMRMSPSDGPIGRWYIQESGLRRDMQMAYEDLCRIHRQGVVRLVNPNGRVVSEYSRG